MNKKKMKDSKKVKITWFPGKKKFKLGSAPTTAFTTKVKVIDGVEIEVKEYEASTW